MCTKEYLKLASLLSQNVKKGTTDILKLLEQESQSAFEQHKNLAKKKGEEAGTKLLISNDSYADDSNGDADVSGNSVFSDILK